MGNYQDSESSLHEHHRARIWQRVERDGVESLAEHEALEYLLFFTIARQDTNPLAHALIQHFGSFCKVLEADPQELAQIPGIGSKSARLIHSVLQFARYYNLKKRKTHLSLDSAEAAAQYIIPLFLGKNNEHLYLILLDDTCHPLQDLHIAEGTPNRVLFDTRKLVREVARTNATCGILAHNHSTGVAVPSEADIATTMSIIQALEPIGVKILDHIVVSGEDSCSMQARGCFPNINT